MPGIPALMLHRAGATARAATGAAGAYASEHRLSVASMLASETRGRADSVIKNGSRLEARPDPACQRPAASSGLPSAGTAAPIELLLVGVCAAPRRAPRRGRATPHAMKKHANTASSLKGGGSVARGTPALSYAAVATVIGAAHVVQAGVNSSLGVALGNFIVAGACSMFTGALIMCGYLRVKVGPGWFIPLHRVTRVTLWWEWTGGLIGVISLMAKMVLVTILGGTVTNVIESVTEVIFTLSIEHAGLLLTQQRRLTPLKAAGAACALGGTLLASADLLTARRAAAGSRDGRAPMLLLFAAIIAVMPGCARPVQATVNGSLSKALVDYSSEYHKQYASAASLLVSAAFFVPALIGALATDPALLTHGVPRSSPWMYTGGLVGAAYVTCAVILPPRLGLTLFFVCVLAGQLAASLALDAVGAFTFAQHAPTPTRVAGVLLTFLGAAGVHGIPAAMRRARSTRSQLPTASPEPLLPSSPEQGTSPDCDEAESDLSEDEGPESEAVVGMLVRSRSEL